MGGNKHPVSSWTVPTEISGVADDRLSWDAATLSRQMVQGPANVLDELVKITADTSQDKVTNFTRRWGVVGLCEEHKWPLEHSRYRGDEGEYGCNLFGRKTAIHPR